MLRMIYLEKQLEFLYFLQGVRGPVVDVLLRCLNRVDTAYYAVALIAFIWIGFSWRWGVRLGLLIAINSATLWALKNAFQLPRPGFFDPNLPMVTLRGFGFPSGGADTAMLLGCLLGFYWKNSWAWPLGLFYALLMGFSRLFLGVHFPIDVLGGWLLGFLFFVAFVKSVAPLEKLAGARPRAALICGILAGVLLQELPLLVAACGIYFSTKYDLYLNAPKGIWKKIGLGLFGVISSFCVGLPLFLLPLKAWTMISLQTVVAGLWISLAVSPFSKKVFHLR